MTISRRELLHLVVVSTTVVATGSACISPQQVGVVQAGNVSDLVVGEVKAVPNVAAFIARDAGGLYAMSTTCTHAGCDISGGISNGKIFCSCHGSVFDANGSVVQGPANSPLVHYAVTVDAAGAITIDGTQEVAASVRTPA